MTRLAGAVSGIVLLSFACSRTPDVTCTQCKIDLTPIASLEGAPVDAEPIAASKVGQFQSGNYIAGPLSDAARLAVYDSTGAFLRLIGRTGAGPGEFDYIDDFAVGPGDTLYVLQRGRITVFSPEFDVTRQVTLDRFPPARRIAVGDDGSLFAAAAGFIGDVSGTSSLKRVWRYDRFGRSAHNIRVPSDTTGTFIRELSVSGDSLLISRSDYRTFVSVSGGPAQPINAQEPGWLRAEKSDAHGSAKRRAPAVVGGRFVGGNLWVAYHSFDAAEPAAQRRGGGNGTAPGPAAAPMLMTLEDWADYAQTVLVIYDPATGSPLASSKPSMNIGGFIGSDKAYSISNDATGRASIQIFRMGIIQPAR